MTHMLVHVVLDEIFTRKEIILSTILMKWHRLHFQRMNIFPSQPLNYGLDQIVFFSM